VQRKVTKTKKILVKMKKSEENGVIEKENYERWQKKISEKTNSKETVTGGI